MKLKPLLPSLKERKRYLVFEIVSKSPISSAKAVSEAIMDVSTRFLGELGMAKAGIMVLNNKYKDNKGMIRVAHKYVDHLKTAIALVKKINNQDVIIKSKGVSGILKKAENRYLKEV